MRLWLKIDAQLARHRKTYRLADLLRERVPSGLFPGLPDPETEWRARAVALLLDFWAYVAEHHPDGDITNAHPWAIRDVIAFWIGPSEWGRQDDPREMLLSSGHLDRESDGRLVVHDWADWAGGGVMQIVGDRQRQANRRQVYAGGDFTGDDWTELVELLSRRCVYCGGHRQRLSTDHVLPLSRGGQHSVGNVVPACRSCNSRKHDRLPEEAGMQFDPQLWQALVGSRFAIKPSNPRPKSSNRTTKGKETAVNSLQHREEKSREEKTREESQRQQPAAGSDEPEAQLRQRLPATYHDALDGYLKSAPYPIAVIQTILAEGPDTGTNGAAGKSWDVIGRALLELRATGEGFRPALFRAYVTRLLRAPAPAAVIDGQTDADRMRQAAAAERERESRAGR